jgi:hypothetical protein
VALAVVATLLPLLRAFGPGRTYMRAAVFPTAYVLAFGIGTPQGLLRPLGLATLACMALSLGAIGVFYAYTRSRTTEMTATVPEPLKAAAEALRALPGDGVLVLPFMYADYVAYASGKKVLWGGHCGDLRPLERITPVLREPIPELLASLGARYVLVDEAFASVDDLALADSRREWRGSSFVVLGAHR